MTKIDIRTVPETFTVWPAAYRLCPVRVPSEDVLSEYGDSDALEQLIALTSPLERHKAGAVPQKEGGGAGTAHSVMAGFSSPYPEWRFSAGKLPHMVVGDCLQAVTEFVCDMYGGFLRDTAQGPCRMNFLLERYSTVGNFKDISDKEVFAGCYEAVDYSVPQMLAQEVAASETAGLLYTAKQGKLLVLTKASAIRFRGNERSFSLEWDGNAFTRIFDYRDMHWRKLRSKK